MGEFPNLDKGISLSGAIEALAASGISTAHVGIFDLMGTFRERRLGINDVAAVMDGGGTFVNVLPQWDAGEQVIGPGPFVGETVSVDPESIRPYPFEDNSCLMVADYRGPSSFLSPRQLLQQQIDKADAMGFGIRSAFESEFYVLEEDASSLRESGFNSLEAFARDNRCWAGESAATHANFVAELSNTLARGGLDLLSLSLELGPGCFEATLRDTSPMHSAEDHLLLKMFTKAFCRQRGLTASFMAQLGDGFQGLSQHPHVSLFDKATGGNLFVGQGNQDMSPIFRHFVAGMLAMIPQAMALTHHTPNSYRRHAPGNWAPKSASWARQNYSAAIRVVTTPGSHCRLEYRLPGADANPCLNLAYILGAGLWGIETKAELPDEFSGGGPNDVPSDELPLAHDLFVAAARLDASDTAKSIWGEAFVQHFIAAIRSEEATLRRETSAAERARYLEVV
ncbi:MAG: glutamine synthetase [Gammaproteobacteria bacterium]|nr:glutamine synthetase [Gammaproteobacteria bacterium]